MHIRNEFDLSVSVKFECFYATIQQLGKGHIIILVSELLEMSC